jgi:hypothetical protein
LAIENPHGLHSNISTSANRPLMVLMNVIGRPQTRQMISMLGSLRAIMRCPFMLRGRAWGLGQFTGEASNNAFDRCKVREPASLCCTFQVSDPAVETSRLSREFKPKNYANPAVSEPQTIE